MIPMIMNREAFLIIVILVAVAFGFLSGYSRGRRGRR